MSALTLEVLPADAGPDLPEDVRRALVDFGTASNSVAVALNMAILAERQATAAEESARSWPSAHAVEHASRQVAQSALSYADQLTAVYAGVTVRYAAYAARVAVAVASGNEPTAPTASERELLPSQLLTALDDHLPQVQFTGSDQPNSVVTDQNDSVIDAREQLSAVVARQLFGTPPTQFDDPAAVARRPSTEFDLVVDFPRALHAYAATLTWAVGVFTGAKPPQ